MNHVEEIVEEIVDEIPGDDDLVLPTSIMYRCVKCFDHFPTVEAFRQHYLIVHIGADVVTSEVDDQSKRHLEKEQKSAPMSFCKRCRARILSSSEDEDEVIQLPRKGRKATGML